MALAPRRTLRKDASRNRELLLRAAREVFAEQGPEVALEEVARAAGVSRMTLYRNFATRDELVATVFSDNVAHIEQRARQLADTLDGAVTLFHEVLAMQLENKGLAYLMGAHTDTGWVAELSTRTAAAFTPLLDTGRKAGIVWREITPADVLLTLHMANTSLTTTDRREPAEVKKRVHQMLHRALFTTQL